MPTNSFFSLKRRTNDHQQALSMVLEPRLDVDAIGPHVNVALGAQIAFQPALVLVSPSVLEPGYGRCGKAAGVLAQQGAERFFEVAGRNALEVQSRNQNLQALRAARVKRHDRRRKPNACILAANAIANPRRVYADPTNAGHDLALRQMPVANQASAPIIGDKI
jgi:hypothetical protein